MEIKRYSTSSNRRWKNKQFFISFLIRIYRKYNLIGATSLFYCGYILLFEKRCWICDSAWDIVRWIVIITFWISSYIHRHPRSVAYKYDCDCMPLIMCHHHATGRSVGRSIRSVSVAIPFRWILLSSWSWYTIEIDDKHKKKRKINLNFSSS